MQLDLFSWQPPQAARPSATVICLPSWIEREARDAADRLLKEPVTRWGQLLRKEDARFYKRLFDRGVKASTAHNAAVTFRNAVRRKLGFVWRRGGAA